MLLYNVFLFKGFKLDKDHIAKNLKAPSYEGFKIQKPSEKEFLSLIDEF